MSKCRCVGGLEDAWEEIQGTGGGETCGTPQNTYWYCCHIGIAVILVLLPYWYCCHIGTAAILVLLSYCYCCHIGITVILVFLLYWCYFILPSSNQRVAMLRWTHNSTIAEQKEYPRGKRIDYILHSAGRGRNCKVTQLSTCLKFNPCREIIPWRKFKQRNRFQVLECSLPLPPAIPASLAALVGTACSYSGNFFMIILG